MKIFISISAGVTQDRWDAMTNKEKKAYINKYPNSKYAKAGKASKPSKAGAASKKIQSKEVKIWLDWANASTKKDVIDYIKEINSDAKTNCKIDKFIPRGDNGYPEARIIASNKAELKKFLKIYAGSSYEDYMLDLEK